MGVAWALSDVWAQGGKGGLDLAELVLEACKIGSDFEVAYPLDMSIVDKVESIARRFYGADGAEFTPEAIKQIN